VLRPALRIARVVVAYTIVVLALLASIGPLRTQLKALDTAVAGNVAAQKVDGIPVKHGLGVTGTKFLAYAKARVPKHAEFQIMLPVIEVPVARCGTAFRRGDFRWVTYQMLPRVETCNDTAKYWVYFGVDPATTPPPTGSKIDTYAPGFAVATLP
jgi:hypothetical protein